MTLKILLVDDNPLFLTTVKKFLGMLQGVEVVAEAHDGPQALLLAEQVQPDLMMLDIVMPGLSGLDVAKIMRNWSQSPRVLFLSMHDNESYRAAARKLGAVGLVGKTNFVAELMPIIAGLTSCPQESIT